MEYNVPPGTANNFHERKKTFIENSYEQMCVCLFTTWEKSRGNDLGLQKTSQPSKTHFPPSL